MVLFRFTRQNNYKKKKKKKRIKHKRKAKRAAGTEVQVATMLESHGRQINTIDFVLPQAIQSHKSALN